jgi:hypothetical protein
VGVAECLGVELEQLAQVVLGKVTCRVLRFIDDTRRQVLLLASEELDKKSLDNSLSLEDFLLDGASGLEAVHEA